MKKTLKWSVLMMLTVFGLTFTSCDDDDDVQLPTVEDVNGEYAGNMTYAVSAQDTVEVNLSVKNDSISFAEFPYGVLVEEIIGKDAAAGIIEKIGTMSYAAAYKATMNATNDSISLELTPEQLLIDIVDLNLKVAVSIEAEENGVFAVKDKNLKFSLTATEAMVGEANFLKNPIKLSFDLNKK